MIGDGPTTLNGQVAVQIGRGAVGIIDDNEIGDVFFSPQTVAASAILIFESSRVTIRDNEVFRSQFGIALASFGGVGNANKNVVRDNELEDNQFGIVLQSALGVGAEVNFNRVRENEVEAEEGTGQTGIVLFAQSADQDTDRNRFVENEVEDHNVGVEIFANADNNRFRDNDFEDNATPVVDNGSGNTFTSGSNYDTEAMYAAKPPIVQPIP